MARTENIRLKRAIVWNHTRRWNLVVVIDFQKFIIDVDTNQTFFVLVDDGHDIDCVRMCSSPYQRWNFNDEIQLDA